MNDCDLLLRLVLDGTQRVFQRRRQQVHQLLSSRERKRNGFTNRTSSELQKNSTSERVGQMYLCVFDLQVFVCDAVCAVQRQALLLPGVSDLVRRLHSLTHLQQNVIRNRLRSAPVPLETHVQRTPEKHLTETHAVCPPEQTPSETVFT